MPERETPSQQMHPLEPLHSFLKNEIVLKEANRLLAEGRKELYAARDILVPFEAKIKEEMTESEREIFWGIDNNALRYGQSVEDHKAASRKIGEAKVYIAIITGKPVVIDVDDVEINAIMKIVSILVHIKSPEWYEHCLDIASLLINESKDAQREIAKEMLDHIGLPELMPKESQKPGGKSQRSTEVSEYQQRLIEDAQRLKEEEKRGGKNGTEIAKYLPFDIIRTHFEKISAKKDEPPNLTGGEET